MIQTQAVPRTDLKPAASRVSRSVAIGYLRTFSTIRLLAYHAALAYYPFIPAPSLAVTAVPLLWLAFPVLDAQRSIGFALFAGFNDTFFITLMFFVSGLFVWPSLQRKGAIAYLRDRVMRLGPPFLVAAALAPVAYYPAYLQAGHQGLAGFWHRWRSLGSWPTGPAWFIWVLLAFDAVAVTLFMGMPGWGDALGRFFGGPARGPLVFYLLLVTVSSLVYVPMALVFPPPLDWVGFGPFFFQVSRMLHYLVYFLVGIGIGAQGIQRGLLAPEGKLARYWFLWSCAGVVSFCVTIVIALHSNIVSLATPPRKSLSAVKGSPLLWGTIGGIAFTVACAACCLACLALFLRFCKKENPTANGARDNAYGMYVIHYPFVIWIQYALLKVQLSALSKALIVFLGTLALTWGVTAALRRSSCIARVI